MHPKGLGLLAVLLLAALSPAQAEIVVDVSTYCVDCINGSTGIGNDDTYPYIKFDRAQTFTVINDGVLTAVDLHGQGAAIQYGSTVRAYIVPVVAGVPVADLDLALASASVTVGWQSIPVAFTLSGFNLPVEAGDELALVLTCELVPGGTCNVSISTLAPIWAGLPVGTLFARQSNSASPLTWIADTTDLVFRTYVDCVGDNCVSALDPKRVTVEEALFAKLEHDVSKYGKAAWGNRLLNMVALARTYYGAGDTQATCAVLTDFVWNVNDLATGKKPKLSESAVAVLISDANELMAFVGCN